MASLNFKCMFFFKTYLEISYPLLCRGEWMDGKINLGGKSSFGKKDHSVLTVNIWRLDLIPFHVVVPPKHFSEYNYTPTSCKFLTFYSTFTAAVD